MSWEGGKMDGMRVGGREGRGGGNCGRGLELLSGNECSD